MKKLLIVIVAIILFGCNNITVPETVIVIYIEKSIKEDYKYFVMTPYYSFYTSTSYAVGDTLKIERVSK